MKKGFFTIAAIVGIMAVSTTAFAAVTLEDAQKKALEAVNLTEEQVIFKTAAEGMDDGRQIFEIDFFVPGETKYEFDIDAETGSIIEQDIDLWELEDDFEYADLIKAAEKQTDSAAASVKAAEGEITELQAKTIALKDAGFKADEITVTKCKKDFDDGTALFEVEMWTADGVEYSYEISAADGRILDKDMDMDD